MKTTNYNYICQLHVLNYNLCSRCLDLW